MPILTILLVIVVIGVILWAINAYLPMEARIKQILNIVVIIFLVVWLLSAFGVFQALSGVKVGKA